MLIDEDIANTLRHLDVRFQTLLISREKDNLKWRRLYRTRKELGFVILVAKVSENRHTVILYTDKNNNFLYDSYG